MQADHERFMSIALNIAARGLGNVYPNPAVGCVIVQNGVIISRGWTQKGGRPHAEIMAIKNARSSVKGATVYVTLEPCCHHKQTISCTLSLISAEISRIVVATKDPDCRMLGKSLAMFNKANIKVIYGVMEEEAKRLNIGFFYTKIFFRPFIILKVATSLDGKIATLSGESKWITADLTRKWVHKLRSECDGIMIGSNTLMFDDPMLTCRLSGLNSPIRIVIDSANKLNSSHNLAKTASILPTWVIVNTVPVNRIAGVKYIEIQCQWHEKLPLHSVINKLSEHGITRLLIEGGGKLNAALFKCGLIDRLIWCRAGKIIGNDGVSAVGDLQLLHLSKAYQFKKSEIIELESDIIEIWDRIEHYEQVLMSAKDEKDLL